MKPNIQINLNFDKAGINTFKISGVDAGEILEHFALAFQPKFSRIFRNA